ncbi:uncharacterized protein LOC142558490 [Dermacentor variabilis]|uniref:uncharacterized protein LOC142558490 n=1 Tax=Dermacentor variabilis TaxID=34621 RepID=UPI003F5AF4FF
MAQSASLTSSKASGSSRLSLQTVNKSNASEEDKGQDVVPGLLYYEFLPLVRRSKTTSLLEFQGFEDVVERASDWYRQICGYRVVSMETVQFKFRDRDPASSSSSGEAKGYRSSRSDEDRTSQSAQKHYYGDGLRQGTRTASTAAVSAERLESSKLCAAFSFRSMRRKAQTRGISYTNSVDSRLAN